MVDLDELERYAEAAVDPARGSREDCRRWRAVAQCLAPGDLLALCAELRRAHERTAALVELLKRLEWRGTRSGSWSESGCPWCGMGLSEGDAHHDHCRLAAALANGAGSGEGEASHGG